MKNRHCDNEKVGDPHCDICGAEETEKPGIKSVLYQDTKSVLIQYHKACFRAEMIKMFSVIFKVDTRSKRKYH